MSVKANNGKLSNSWRMYSRTKTLSDACFYAIIKQGCICEWKHRSVMNMPHGSIEQWTGCTVHARCPTSSSLRGGVNFHEISFDDVIVVIQPWYKFFANVTDKFLFAIFPKIRTFQF